MFHSRDLLQTLLALSLQIKSKRIQSFAWRPLPVIIILLSSRSYSNTSLPHTIGYALVGSCGLPGRRCTNRQRKPWSCLRYPVPKPGQNGDFCTRKAVDTRSVPKQRRHRYKQPICGPCYHVIRLHSAREQRQCTTEGAQCHQLCRGRRCSGKAGVYPSVENTDLSS